MQSSHDHSPWIANWSHLLVHWNVFLVTNDGVFRFRLCNRVYYFWLLTFWRCIQLRNRWMLLWYVWIPRRCFNCWPGFCIECFHHWRHDQRLSFIDSFIIFCSNVRESMSIYLNQHRRYCLTRYNRWRFTHNDSTCGDRYSQLDPR